MECNCVPVPGRILIRADNIGTVYLKTLQQYDFAIYNRALYTIDKSGGIPDKCGQCGHNYNIYLYEYANTIYATYDGKTSLPLKSFNLNVYSFMYIGYYNIPSFGTFLHIMDYTATGRDRFRILYNIHKHITLSRVPGLYNHSYIIDGNPVVVCYTYDREAIMVNSDGEILFMEIIYANDKYSFITKHGQLKKTPIVYNYWHEPSTWTYTSLTSGANIKPAVTLAED